CRGDANALKADAEFFGGDLSYFLKQALAHFGAAMIEMNRTILVDMNQSAGLIEDGEREGNAELHRRQRDPALEDRRRGVEFRDFAPAAAVIRGPLQLLDQPLDHVVIFHGLAVRRDITAATVEISLAHIERIAAEVVGDGIDDAFDREHA